MHRFAIYLALLVLCLIGSVSSAQDEPQQSRGAYNLILVTDDPASPAGDRLLSMFADGGELAGIAKACNTFRFKSDDTIFLERYAEDIPPNMMPAVALDRGDGGVVFKAQGSNVPSSASQLKKDLIFYAKLDRELRSGGSKWTQEDCPSCPDDSRPEGPFRRPGGPLNPDSWIPDSVEINPQVRLFDGDGTTTIAVIGGVVCFVVVFVIVVTMLGFFVYVVFFRD